MFNGRLSWSGITDSFSIKLLHELCLTMLCPFKEGKNIVLYIKLKAVCVVRPAEEVNTLIYFIE